MAQALEHPALTSKDTDTFISSKRHIHCRRIATTARRSEPTNARGRREARQRGHVQAPHASHARVEHAEGADERIAEMAMARAARMAGRARARATALGSGAHGGNAAFFSRGPRGGKKNHRPFLRP